MLEQCEGSHAVAHAVAMCRPEVICAYPISPQTHIVEGLGERVKSGALTRCEFINVESEFAAMSVAIGASAAGARAYTATASQGLLFMAEAVYNASGLGLPIVMTVANRAIGAPINIWNDHPTAGQCASGWPGFAESNQNADLHIQGFRMPSSCRAGVVCMDASSSPMRSSVRPAREARATLPRPTARAGLDPDEPVSICTQCRPEAYRSALRRKARSSRPCAMRGGADSKRSWARCGAAKLQREDADTIAVALVLVGRQDTIATRDAGHRIGVIGITSFRRPPRAARGAIHANRSRRREVFRVAWRIVSRDVRYGLARPPQPVTTVVAGLGGRAITKTSLHRLFLDAMAGTLEPLTFLDLDWGIVNRVLEREKKTRRSGPVAEGVLRDVGTVASRIG